MASSVAGCLSSVGYDMPRVFDVIPLLEIDSIVEALTVQLQDVGSAVLYCPREAPTRGACSAFCSLGLVAMAYLLLLVVWLVLLMLTGLTGLVVRLKHAPDEADTSLLLTSSEDGNHVRLQLSQVKLICRFSPQSSASSTLAHPGNHQTPDYQAHNTGPMVESSSSTVQQHAPDVAKLFQLYEDTRRKFSEYQKVLKCSSTRML
ncbi:TPA: hypothetical protein ACH3X3_000513 [Trebouxia sp. C0006]